MYPVIDVHCCAWHVFEGEPRVAAIQCSYALEAELNTAYKRIYARVASPRALSEGSIRCIHRPYVHLIAITFSYDMLYKGAHSIRSMRALFPKEAYAVYTDRMYT